VSICAECSVNPPVTADQKYIFDRSLALCYQNVAGHVATDGDVIKRLLTGAQCFLLDRHITKEDRPIFVGRVSLSAMSFVALQLMAFCMVR
jgi:hypothetical protein